MTIAEKIRELNNEELSKFLFEFSAGFYSETIDGLCNIECNQSRESCKGCIEKWINGDVTTYELFQQQM